MGLISTIVALALAGTAQAQGPERLATAAFAVPRDPSGQKASAAIGAVLTDRVARHSKLRLIEPGRALSGDPRTREEETLIRARTALADGRRAYDALTLDDAIARLGQAVSLYQQTGPLLGDVSELTSALAYLGAALTLRGSSDEGVSTFLELLTIDPAFSPEGFPPTVTRIFDKAVERLAAVPRGSVEIYTTPPYSAVYVDGRFRGVSPATLSDLHAGTHYIRLEQNGYVTHGAPLEIAPNQRITSQTRLISVKSGAELRDLLSRASREVLEEGMGQSTRALSRLLVADSMILISVSQSGKDATITGAAFDVGAATRVVTERAVLDAEGANFLKDAGAMIDKLLATASGSGPPSAAQAQGDPGGNVSGFGLSQGGGTAVSGGGGGPSASQGPPTTVSGGMRDDGSPDPGMVVGWLSVGLGTVGLGVGVVFAILAKQTHDDYLATSQASPDLTAIRDTGKTRSLIADVGMIAGGALVATGVVVLLLTSKKSDAPEDLLVGIAPLEGGGLVVIGGAF